MTLFSYKLVQEPYYSAIFKIGALQNINFVLTTKPLHRKWRNPLSGRLR